MGDRGEGEPGRIAGELPGRGVGQRPVAQVGGDLLDDGVVAVLLLGLGHGERRVGEDRVVAPDREQFAGARGGLVVLVADPADGRPGTVADGGDRRGDRGVHPGGDREPRAAAAARGDERRTVVPGAGPHDDRAGTPGRPALAHPVNSPTLRDDQCERKPDGYLFR